MVGDFVIYSNSPVGIRRVLDAQCKESKSLADAKDFHYLRTIFPADDAAEDGLVYLSDAFLRQLTGPASRIKEKRRIEALTSLYMMTNAALFCAWETGKLPANQVLALAGAGLRPEDVAVPEGKGIRWDAERQVAVSDAYNTLQFATPLIELPIDRVTPAEEKAYGDFREEYSKLWRTYYDPIGLRFNFDAKRVRIETHILPVVASEQYQVLRQLTGQGKFQFQPRTESIVDFRLSVGEGAALGFHVDENALVRDMVELLIRWEADPRFNLRKEYDRLFWKLPFGVSVSANALPFMNSADDMVNVLKNISSDEPKMSKHKDVPIHHVPISEEKYRQIMALVNAQPDISPLTTILALVPTQEVPPTLHVTAIDKEVFVSANEDYLKKLIDQSKKPAVKKAVDEARESNAGLFISPANARTAASLFSGA